MKKVIIIIMSLLFLIGCTRYYTRLFVIDGMQNFNKQQIMKHRFSPPKNLRMKINKYELYPDIGAFSGSSGGSIDLKNWHEFGVSFEIKDTDPNVPDYILELTWTDSIYNEFRDSLAQMIYEKFPIDTLVLTFFPSNEEIYVPIKEVRRSSLHTWGASFICGPLIIEPSIDSLIVKTVYNSEKLEYPTSYTQPISFKMYRFESSTLGPVMH